MLRVKPRLPHVAPEALAPTLSRLHSFYPRPPDPASPYQPQACPDCERCRTGYCVHRELTPGFVTCARECAACAYTAYCPWTPQRFRHDPG